MSLTFWDTVAGQRLADVLTRSLPKIADAVNVKNNPQQHISQIAQHKLYDYLREEQAAGRRLVQAIPIPTPSATEYIVITE